MISHFRIGFTLSFVKWDFDCVLGGWLAEPIIIFDKRFVSLDLMVSD
jgi:hypothetical protein